MRYAGILMVAGLTLTGSARLAQANPADAARELKMRLEERKLGAIAAADPADPGRFVAALYVPGQLLVVSGRYPSPAHLEYVLGQQNYQEAYSAMYAAADKEGRLFVQDMGADGPPQKKGDVADVVYENGVTQIILDKPASEGGGSPYDKTHSTISSRYEHALRVLLERLTATAAPTSTTAQR